MTTIRSVVVHPPHAAEDRVRDPQNRPRRTQSGDVIGDEVRKPTWAIKREIIRALVQRIEIGPTKVAIVLRLPTDARDLEPIVVTLSRV